jgi:hypothetical protein
MPYINSARETPTRSHPPRAHQRSATHPAAQLYSTLPDPVLEALNVFQCIRAHREPLRRQRQLR